MYKAFALKRPRTPVSGTEKKVQSSFFFFLSKEKSQPVKYITKISKPEAGRIAQQTAAEEGYLFSQITYVIIDKQPTIIRGRQVQRTRLFQTVSLLNSSVSSIGNRQFRFVMFQYA